MVACQSQTFTVNVCDVTLLTQDTNFWAGIQQLDGQ